MDSFNKDWQRMFSEQRANRPQGPGKPGKFTGIIISVLGAIVGLFIIFGILKGFYTEWLWFDSLGYASVYTTILKTKILIFFVAAVIFAILFLGNLLIATRLVPKTESHFWPWGLVKNISTMLRWGVILGTIFLSLIFGWIAQGNWETILLYFNWQPFGVTDPVFLKEIGFYVYSLPFLNFLRSWFTGALIVSLLGGGGVYLLSYGVQRLKFDFARPVLAHMGGLLILILGLFAWGYWLGIWELVFSPEGVVFGAGFADMNARLPSRWILIAVVVTLVIVTVIAIFRKNYRLPLYGIGGWIVIAIIAGAVYPAIVQRLQVTPNELVKESPYIGYNIEATRQAFALDRIEEQAFPAEDTPTLEDISGNELTISNIRLWDPRPLQNTYDQIQSFRPYYDFNDVDIDRYMIDGEYRQVMLSAREMSAEKLSGQAQTWVNRTLQYTHGYGLALSPVNEVTTQGLPNLLVKDIPPEGIMDIVQPQIYFGEKTNEFVIVNTESQEFDYPMGDENVIGEYEGSGGVDLSGFVRRLAYAWQMADFNILISSELTPQSRILYYRNIQERVNKLAPFLALDKDPYLVVIEGRLFWIQDAYTITDRYPYSTPVSNGINYIRNSVKAVIDAYNGDVTFYVTDPEDALIRTWESAFPDLFMPMEAMPETVKEHLRYPEDMFKIQSTVYATYHMSDVRVFYNNEDPWAVPKEVYFGSEQQMEPYFIIMRLPDEEQEEFLLMLPFTPVGKNVTIGWLAARCDGDNYGTLLVYTFPKDRLVYGPSQIENRIGQDTVITEQLALWSRGGSRVIRGNLLLIPLGDSIMFVEPVFLEAETGGLPELKRVIVAAGDRIAMKATLAESLAAIFGEATVPDLPVIIEPETGEPGEVITVPSDIAALIEQAQEHYDKAVDYQKAGDWAGYGEELAALEEILAQLAELTAEQGE